MKAVRLGIITAAVFVFTVANAQSPTPGASQSGQQAPAAQSPQGARRPNPIPEKFTNLQVLPKDITRDQLVQTMRGFAMSTGTRCIFCHVSKDPNDKEGNDLSKFDFASDANDHKKIARAMLVMTKAINQEHINAKIKPLMGDEAKNVTCFTCHQGQKHPQHKAAAPPAPPAAPTPATPPTPTEKKER